MQGGGSTIVYHKELSYKILGILFDVYNELGYGYHEKHYEKAIEKYFIDSGIIYHRQAPFKISFRGEIIGRYYLDFLVDNKVALEIKKAQHFSRRNIEQVKAYLKITNLELDILANFTPTGVKLYRVLNPQNQIE